MLSMEAYKGLANSSHKLKKYCSKHKLKFTAKKCQKAFNDFALHGDTKKLEKTYSSQIMNCFTARDIRSLKK